MKKKKVISLNTFIILNVFLDVEKETIDGKFGPFSWNIQVKKMKISELDKNEIKPDNEDQPNKNSKFKITLMIGIIIGVVLTLLNRGHSFIQQTSWNDFVSRILPSGKVNGKK